MVLRQHFPEVAIFGVGGESVVQQQTPLNVASQGTGSRGRQVPLVLLHDPFGSNKFIKHSQTHAAVKGARVPRTHVPDPGNHSSKRCALRLLLRNVGIWKLYPGRSDFLHEGFDLATRCPLVILLGGFLEPRLQPERNGPGYESRHPESHMAAAACFRNSARSPFARPSTCPAVCPAWGNLRGFRASYCKFPELPAG